MRDYAWLIGCLALILINTGCATMSNPPKPTFCGIYRPGVAECIPPNANQKDFFLDLNSIDALGYQCIHPREFSYIKAWIKVLGELEGGY